MDLKALCTLVTSPGLTKTWRIMKLITVILLSACLTASAIGHTQKVTISTKNTKLEKVFADIRLQTGYDFLYNDEMLQKANLITLELRSVDIKDALNKIFLNQPFSFSILERTVVVKPKEAQLIEQELPVLPIDVHGRVLNEKGEPVEGVTVTVKGTKVATATNSNGEFRLAGVDDAATLVFTSTNMEAFEIKVEGKNDLAISLKTKVTALGDVQITGSTGYQTIKPNEATGALTVIDNKTLNQQVGTNILNRLDGVTSGLYFNIGKFYGSGSANRNKTNIAVRGPSTINGQLDPLIVMDGYIYEGDINNINPNDIENVTILKDAAATSIWGVRAANGVIVISTKRGRFNQKLEVSFNENLIISEKPDLYQLSQISSADEINVEQTLYNANFFNSQISNRARPGLTPAVEIFIKRKSGLISAADSASQIDALKQIDSRDQYSKYFYRSSITQQYSASVKGGSSNNAYTLSANFDKNIGTQYTKFNKFNLKLQNIYRPTKNLDVDLGVYYTNSTSESGRLFGYDQILVGSRRVPYLEVADPQSNPLATATFYRLGYIDTAGAGKLLNWNFYPLDEYKHRKSVTKLNELYVNIGAQYRFFKWMSFDAKYQYQKQESETVGIQDLESFGARNTINSFSQLNRVTGIVTYIIPLGSIREVNSGIVQSHTYRGQFNFRPTWKNNVLNTIIGAEMREVTSTGTGYTTYGYYSDPLSYARIDFVNTYPNFVTASRGSIAGAQTFSGTTLRYVSVFTNSFYTYKQRYIVSFSARRDGSNIFGVKINDKWKPLWSTGLSWDITKEHFYDLKFIPALRLRATYGYSGSVDPNRVAVPVGFASFNSDLGLPYVRVGSLNDPQLKWEQVGQINIGVDFSLKNKILWGSIDYWHKYADNLYAPAPFDYTGYGNQVTVIQNIGKMEGQGLDVIFNSNIIDKGIKWNSQLLFNYNTSKITAYYTNSANQLSALVGAGETISSVIGKPLYATAAYKWAGLDKNGNPQGYLNGQPSTNYQAIITEASLASSSSKEGSNVIYKGTSNPAYFGSFINNVSWKGLTFTASISYRMKYWFRKPAISYDQLISSGIGNSEFANRWQKPGDELITNVPSFVYPNISSRDAFYRNSEINVLKADNIRLQYINLSYSLGNELLKKSAFKNVEVYINGSNLGILWRANKAKLDPDYPSLIQPGKTFAVGIKGNF